VERETDVNAAREETFAVSSTAAAAPWLLARVATLRRDPDDRVPVSQALRRALNRRAEHRFDGALLSATRRWAATAASSSGPCR
jgi:hypothetical protein